MKEDPLVSIIMRSYNEAWALRETLPALLAQEYRHWELIVIDSGSSDGSQDLIRAMNPAHFLEITPQEYVPGVVLNRGMELARSNYCVFLNADATPVDEHWLRPLAESLFDPQVAAVFGRQIPRPDCEAVFACDYDRCFGPRRESASWDHFFSMVNSGLRKDVWEPRRIREDIQYAEDDEYTRRCKAEGYEIRYVPGSVAIHSHNYTPGQSYKRAFGDARALGKALTDAQTRTPWLKSVALGWVGDLRHDLRYCRENDRLAELPHAMGIRWQQRLGRHAGFLAGRAEAAELAS